MKSAIWKYEVPITDSFELKMTPASTVLSVQMQHGQMVLWAHVPDTEWSRREKRTFAWHGTGNPCPARPGKFIGTVQLEGGALVFHLFETTIRMEDEG